MSITASVSSSPITARVSGSSISASVGSSPIRATASGGVGPQGPQGAAGNAGTVAIAAAADAEISGLADGDLLRYSSSSSKWQNYPQDQLMDAGNF